MGRLDTDALAYELRLYAALDDNRRLREALDAVGRQIGEMVASARRTCTSAGVLDPRAVFHLTAETYALDCIMQLDRLARSSPPAPCSYASAMQRDMDIRRGWEALQGQIEITRLDLQT